MSSSSNLTRRGAPATPAVNLPASPPAAHLRAFIPPASPPVVHLRAFIHTSALQLNPSVVAFIGIQAARFKRADLARITTTITAVNTAEARLKMQFPTALHDDIEERCRLIFEMFAGPKLLVHTPAGHMGANTLKYPRAGAHEEEGDRDAVEAAVTRLDGYIVTARAGSLLLATGWLSSHSIEAVGVSELASQLKKMDSDVYEAGVQEHKRGMAMNDPAHLDWMRSYRLPVV